MLLAEGIYYNTGVQHEVSVESMGGSGKEEAEEEEEEEEEGEKEGDISTKKPAMVALPDDVTAMQIDCGTFHTGRMSLFLVGCVCVSSGFSFVCSTAPAFWRCVYVWAQQTRTTWPGKQQRLVRLDLTYTAHC